MKKTLNTVKKCFYTKDGEEQKEINKQLVIIIVSIFVTVISVLGVTYSAFVWSDNSLKTQSLVVGNIELNINSKSESLGSNLNYPVAKADEETLTPYTFTITNNGSLTSTYKLKIVGDDAYTNTMDTQYIYMSMEGGRTINRTALSEYSDISIDEGLLSPGESKTYNLRLWIVENAPNSVIGKEWHGKIVLESSQTEIIADANVSNLSLINDANVNTEATSIDFQITNSEDATKYFNINLDEITMNDELNSENFKWRLLEGNTIINEGNFFGADNDLLLQRSIEIPSETTKNYKLLIWFSDNDETGINLTDKTLNSKITVEINDKITDIALSESPVLINTISGENIKNMKLYGNTIDGNSVGDLVSDESDANNGRYLIPITVYGKNLLKYGLKVASADNGTVIRNYMISTLLKLEPGQYTLGFDTITNATSYRLSWVIFTDSAATNSISSITNDYFKLKAINDVGYYNSSVNFFKYNGNTNVSVNDIKITVSQTCYFGFLFADGDTKLGNSSTPSVAINPQLEQHSKRTSFETYEPTTYSIYLDAPLRSNGDKRDYIDFEQGKVIRWIDENGNVLSTPIEETIEIPEITTKDTRTTIQVDTTVKPLIEGNY